MGIEISNFPVAPDGSIRASASLEKAAYEGRAFVVVNQTGVATQAGLSVTTPVLTLANPVGSGVRGKLHFAGASFLVVFAAAAAVWVAQGRGPELGGVTGTLTTAHRNLKMGGKEPGIKAFLAATLPEAPVAISLLGAGLTGAITTIPQIATLGRWYNGVIQIMPGFNLSIQTSTASGAAGTLCEYIWEEEDIA